MQPTSSFILETHGAITQETGIDAVNVFGRSPVIAHAKSSCESNPRYYEEILHRIQPGTDTAR